MRESQVHRIERLGKPKIWYGQDSFYYPVKVPCLEHVTLASSIEGLHVSCAGCGRDLEAEIVDGRRYGVRAVVLHENLWQFKLYHEGCEPERLPWAHDWAGVRGEDDEADEAASDEEQRALF